MMYLVSVAVLISQLRQSRADTCAAAFPKEGTEGGITPLNFCTEFPDESTGAVTRIKYYCDDNGDAYTGIGYTEPGCVGDAPLNFPVNPDEYTVDCNADPCDVATLNICSDADCETGCASLPTILDQCSAGTNEETGEPEYTKTYCGTAGLTIGQYSDDACTDEVSGFPFEIFAMFAAGDDGCVTIDSDCVATDDGGDDEPYVDCPTGAVYAVLDEGAFEAPYFPLGLCNKYGEVGAMKVTCDADGVAEYGIYFTDDCSGSPFISEVLDFNDDQDPDDTTTFRTDCDAELDCTFARFTIYPYDEESMACAGEDGKMEQAVLVGECLNNGTMSFLMACDDTSVTRSVYATADCSGVAVEVEDVMLDFGGDERCPAGEVVDCYMTEPDYANPTIDGTMDPTADPTMDPTTMEPTMDPTADPTSDPTTDSDGDSDEPPVDNSSAFKTNVGQVALILVALMMMA